MSNKLINVNYGLSSVYSTPEGTITEINYKLTSELRNKIRKHEARHKSDRHYSKEDFKNDFMSENSYFFESLKFCFINLECMIGFFPYMFSYYMKYWTFNKSALYPFIYFGLIFSAVVSGVIWSFAGTNFWFILLGSIIGYTIFVALLNLILLGYTHWVVKKQKDFQYKEVLE